MKHLGATSSGFALRGCAGGAIGRGAAGTPHLLGLRPAGMRWMVRRLSADGREAS